MKQTETAGTLKKNQMLPKGRYAIQCVEEEFKESAKGNMMIERTWEIIDPATVLINGTEVVVAGVQAKQYLTTVVFKLDDAGNKVVDAEKVKSMMPSVFEDYSKLGLPCEEIDENNPTLGAKGLVAAAILYGKEFPMTKDPTPEQIKKGQKYGDPILGEDNKPIKGFQTNISMLLGLSSVKAVQAAY